MAQSERFDPAKFDPSDIDVSFEEPGRYWLVSPDRQAAIELGRIGDEDELFEVVLETALNSTREDRGLEQWRGWRTSFDK
jgi:hypothetical protein